MPTSMRSKNKIALICFGNEENYGLLFVGGELLQFDQEIRYFDAEEGVIAGEIIAWKPDYLFYSPLTRYFPAALDLLREVRLLLPGVVSVFGGHHSCSDPAIIEREETDVVVVGPVRGS